MAMTEEQKVMAMLRMQQMRGKQMRGNQSMSGQTGGQVSGMAPTNIQPSQADYGLASQDFTGREAALAQRIRSGQQAMMSPMAQGKRVGDIYVAPTWSENLAAGLRQGVGAYDVAKARQGQEALNQEQQESAASAGRIAQYERAAAEEQRGIENQQRQDRIDATTQRNQLLDKRAEADRIESLRRHNEMVARQSAATDESLRRWKEADEKSEEKTRLAAEKDLNTEALKYSKELSKANLPKAEANLDALNTMLTPFLDETGNLPEGGNLPGVGGIQNVDTFGVGGAITSVGDVFTKTINPESTLPTGKNVNQAVQNVLNTQMVDEAGKAQTVQEMVRQRKGKGFDIFARDENLLEGLRTIKQAFADKRANIESGFTKEAKDLYNSRGNEKPSVDGLKDPNDMTDEELAAELGL